MSKLNIEGTLVLMLSTCRTAAREVTAYFGADRVEKKRREGLIEDCFNNPAQRD